METHGRQRHAHDSRHFHLGWAHVSGRLPAVIRALVRKDREVEKAEVMTS